MKAYQSLTNLTTGATINQIIKSDPKAGDLLTSIGLPAKDHENETLRSICKQRQWSEVEIMGWVKRHCLPKNSSDSQANDSRVTNHNRNFTSLTKYLHSSFIIPNLTLLKEINNDWPRVHALHGNQYPWLKNVNWHFDIFSQALKMYSEFEEKKFYPLVRELDNQEGEVLDGTIQKLKRSLQIITEDQRRLIDLMNTIRQKGNELKNPGEACSTLRILNQNFKMLFEHLEKQFEIEERDLNTLVKDKLKTL